MIAIDHQPALIYEGQERHVSCQSRHYFTNARKMLWSREGLKIIISLVMWSCKTPHGFLLTNEWNCP